jgi:hypothetical protein
MLLYQPMDPNWSSLSELRMEILFRSRLTLMESCLMEEELISVMIKMLSNLSRFIIVPLEFIIQMVSISLLTLPIRSLMKMSLRFSHLSQMNNLLSFSNMDRKIPVPLLLIKI